MRHKAKIIILGFVLTLFSLFFAGCGNSNTEVNIKELKNYSLCEFEQKEATTIVGDDEYYMYFKKDDTTIGFKVNERLYKAYKRGTPFNIYYKMDGDIPVLTKLEPLEKEDIDDQFKDKDTNKLERVIGRIEGNVSVGIRQNRY